MKKTLASLINLLLFISIECWAGGDIDQAINDVVSPISNKVAGWIFTSVNIGDASLPLVVVWLMAAAVFFTFYFNFINLRGFRHAIDLVKGKYSDPNAPGEVSHFQALSTALSGTVGLGNIAGVAVAVSVGGPGATFWMILAGFLGMSTKFVECTLGVKFRHIHDDGTVSGGPMYYLSEGLAQERGLGTLGRFLAIFFAVCAVGGSLGGGNLFQANQAYKMVVSVSGGDASFLADKGWLFGLLVAVVVGAVIIGGIKGIARVAAKLVPLMAVVYIITALVIIISHITALPAAFGAIVAGAFSPEGVAGGFIGVLIQGFKRAAFSNEAGIGSASIAHSAVKTSQPITEGFVSLLEPFIDTVVVCTITALVIIITGVYTNESGLGGVELTSSAFASSVSWFPYVLALAVVLFAFSTMLSWSYYGVKGWSYLFGKSVLSDTVFKLIFCSFIIIGCTMELDAVVLFSDSMIFAMCIANIVGLYLLAPVVKRELNDYMAALNAGNLKTYDQ